MLWLWNPFTQVPIIFVMPYEVLEAIRLDRTMWESLRIEISGEVYTRNLCEVLFAGPTLPQWAH